MKKSKSETKKALIVTDKQLDVIKDACELYGRIQLGQFERFAEIITQTGFSGWGLRVQPKRNEGENDEKYKARSDRIEEHDMIVCNCIKSAVEGIYRYVYNYEGKPRTNEADIALDIWAKLDGRREDGKFSMSPEPLPQVQEWKDEPDQKAH